MRPWNKRKDSKNSYEQSSWEFAANSHTRYTRMLVLAKQIKNQNLIARITQSLADLESRYPQLKTNLNF